MSNVFDGQTKELPLSVWMSFEAHLRTYHGYSLDEVEPTPSRGYWVVKAGCPGGQQCKHAFRIAGGTCRGDVRLTVYFQDPDYRDARGRFLSPYRTWRAEREKLEGQRGARDEAVSVLQS